MPLSTVGSFCWAIGTYRFFRFFLHFQKHSPDSRILRLYGGAFFSCATADRPRRCVRRKMMFHHRKRKGNPKGAFLRWIGEQLEGPHLWLKTKFPNCEIGHVLENMIESEEPQCRHQELSIDQIEIIREGVCKTLLCNSLNSLKLLLWDTQEQHSLIRHYCRCGTLLLDTCWDTSI